MTLSSDGPPALRAYDIPRLPAAFIWVELHGPRRYAWGSIAKPLGFWRVFASTAESDAFNDLRRF